MLVAADTTDVTARRVTDAEQQLRFDTAQAFIDVLLAKSTLDLAQQNLTRLLERRRHQPAAADRGRSVAERLLQDLAAEAAVRAGRLGRRGRARPGAAWRCASSSATRRSPTTSTSSATSRTRPTTVSLDDLRAAALASRPDLQAAQAGVKLAQDSVALERSNAARDVDGEVEYRPSRVAQRARLRRGDRSADSRPEPGQHRARDGGRVAGGRERRGRALRRPGRRRRGVRRLPGERPDRRPLPVRISRPGAGVARHQHVRLPARRRQPAGPARRRADVSVHADRRFARRSRPTWSSVQQINFVVGKQVVQ